MRIPHPLGPPLCPAVPFHIHVCAHPDLHSSPKVVCCSPAHSSTSGIRRKLQRNQFTGAIPSAMADFPLTYPPSTLRRHVPTRDWAGCHCRSHARAHGSVGSFQPSPRSASSTDPAIQVCALLQQQIHWDDSRPELCLVYRWKPVRTLRVVLRAWQPRLTSLRRDVQRLWRQ